MRIHLALVSRPCDMTMLVVSLKVCTVFTYVHLLLCICVCLKTGIYMCFFPEQEVYGLSEHVEICGRIPLYV